MTGKEAFLDWLGISHIISVVTFITILPAPATAELPCPFFYDVIVRMLAVASAASAHLAWKGLYPAHSPTVPPHVEAG